MLLFKSDASNLPTTFTKGGSLNTTNREVYYYISYVQSGSTSVDINLLTSFNSEKLYQVEAINLSSSINLRKRINADAINSVEVKFNGTPNAGDLLEIYAISRDR